MLLELPTDALFVHDSNLRTETAFGKYNRIPNSLLRDPGELDIRPQHAKRSWEFWKRDEANEIDIPSSEVAVSSLQVYANETDTSSASSEPVARETPSSSDPYERLQPDAGAQFPIGSSPTFKKGFSFLPDAPVNPDTLKHRAVPAPTLRYDPDTMTLRERRFLGLPYGGTVVVHYLKRNEWFMETALALMGREKFWDTGLDPPAYQPYVPSPPTGDHLPPYGEDGDGDGRRQKKVATIPTWNGKTGKVEMVPAEWGSARMYGSPLVKENGYVSLGRTVPWDALQKSEEGKYGKLRGSPRQRFADMPNAGENKQTTSSSSLSNSASSDGMSSSLALSSSSSTLQERSSSASSSSEQSDLHTHTASSSSLESQSHDSSTDTHTHSLQSPERQASDSQSDRSGSLDIQNSDPAALVFA